MGWVAKTALALAITGAVLGAEKLTNLGSYDANSISVTEIPADEIASQSLLGPRAMPDNAKPFAGVMHASAKELHFVIGFAGATNPENGITSMALCAQNLGKKGKGSDFTGSDEVELSLTGTVKGTDDLQGTQIALPTDNRQKCYRVTGDLHKEDNPHPSLAESNREDTINIGLQKTDRTMAFGLWKLGNEGTPYRTTHISYTDGKLEVSHSTGKTAAEAAAGPVPELIALTSPKSEQHPLVDPIAKAVTKSMATSTVAPVAEGTTAAAKAIENYYLTKKPIPGVKNS